MSYYEIATYLFPYDIWLNSNLICGVWCGENNYTETYMGQIHCHYTPAGLLFAPHVIIREKGKTVAVPMPLKFFILPEKEGHRAGSLAEGFVETIPEELGCCRRNLLNGRI